MRLLAFPLTLLLLVPTLPATEAREQTEPPLPVAKPNDNRRPAGQLRGNVLTLRLVVQMAKWYPQSATGPSVDVEVFGEEGKAPSVPRSEERRGGKDGG